MVNMGVSFKNEVFLPTINYFMATSSEFSIFVEAIEFVAYIANQFDRFS